MDEDRIDVVGHGAVTGRLAAAADDRSALSMPAAGSETPWPTAAATGIGSMPGTDPVEAAALIAGELFDLPHLVELPERGAGADMIGRSMAICVDMPAEVVPSGWRLTRRPGRDLRRAGDFLAWDLDAAEQHFAGAAWLKVQAAGPWTLAAHVELPSGNRAVLDPGAVDDLAGSLAEGLAQQLSDLGRRLPGTALLVQIDEPSLPDVLAGTLATASGFGTVPAVGPARALEILSGLVSSLGGRQAVAHCCHPGIPIALLREAGFAALSMDLTTVGTAVDGLDAIGEAIEAGAALLAGLVPTRPPDGDRMRADRESPGGDRMRPDREARAGGEPSPADTVDFHTVARPLLELWHRLGLSANRLAQVTVTPTCGLAGASPAWARRGLTLARDAARLVGEQAQQG